jgi:hypothetical protein
MPAREAGQIIEDDSVVGLVIAERRTYASLRCACGDDPVYTGSQIGHEDPRFTLKAYAKATKRRERLSGPHLKAYDRAIEWAQMGTSAVDTPEAIPPETTKTPV